LKDDRTITEVPARFRWMMSESARIFQMEWDRSCAVNRLYFLLHCMQASQGLAGISNKFPTRGSFVGPGGKSNREWNAVYSQVRQSAVVVSTTQVEQPEKSMVGMVAGSKEVGRCLLSLSMNPLESGARIGRKTKKRVLAWFNLVEIPTTCA
jgi:hypothetical protein